MLPSFPTEIHILSYGAYYRTLLYIAAYFCGLLDDPSSPSHHPEHRSYRADRTFRRYRSRLEYRPVLSGGSPLLLLYSSAPAALNSMPGFYCSPGGRSTVLLCTRRSCLFNFVREWQPGVGFEFYPGIGQNHTPEVFFCRMSPPQLHCSVSSLPLCSDTDLFFLCTWEVHAFFIRQVRGNWGFG